MFDSKKQLSSRITDATDLLIDFATLGEYGLEPVAGPSPKANACEARHRRPTPANTKGRRPHQIEGPFLLRP